MKAYFRLTLAPAGHRARQAGRGGRRRVAAGARPRMSSASSAPSVAAAANAVSPSGPWQGLLRRCVRHRHGPP